MTHSGTHSEQLRLTPRQQRAVVLLLRGLPIDDVCRHLRIGRSTVFRWRRQPAFRAALVAAQKGTFAAAVARLTAISESAVDRLGELIRSPDERVALAASSAVLKAAEAHEMLDLEADFERLKVLVEKNQTLSPAGGDF